MAKKKSISKGKYEKNSFVKEVFNVFLSNPNRAFNFRQVSKAMNVSDQAGKQLVKEIIEKLSSAREIMELNRGKFRLHPENLSKLAKQNTVTGIVDMKQTGKAYILCEGMEEDIYIAANNTNRALNGDEVKVLLFPKRKGRKTEGRIIEVVKRSKRHYVGVLDVVKDYGFLIPDDTSVPVDIFIPASGFKGARKGQKVVVSISDWPEHSKSPFGEIIEVLGEPGNNEVEMNAILVDFGFPLKFPDRVEKEAGRISTEIPSKEYKKRRDFRGVFTCTIDPLDAKDFDDAISFRKSDNGLLEIGVHIADVSHYVQEGSLLDGEAYERATSVYLVDRVVPMLPEALSNMVCSLRPDEDKLCFSVVFEMDENGNIRSEWFGKTVIRSSRRYHYEEVQEILDGKDDPYSEELLTLNRIATVLRKKRFEKGSIAFRSSEVRFELDQDGKPLRAFVRSQQDSNRLIEDFMLLANRSVAEKIGKKQGNKKARTFVYRIHDEPNPEKLQTFSDFVRKLGYKLSLSSKKSIAVSMNNLFKTIEGKGEENIIEAVAIRTMSKAEYSTENIGHYGLAFPYYTHFTSPIRRYPDMIAHRLLEKYLEGAPSVAAEPFEAMCKHATEMEQKAQEAERASVKYKQAEYLLDKTGKRFAGLISGVSKWGLFVELEESHAEGLVPLRDMADDYYYLDEDNFRIVGYNRGKEYKLGEKINVIVREVNLAKKQINLILA
ncbi:MAG: ribonuclease R [Bacteroidales bacterium]|nr:ribonuclease R [Bacteroidales bacterium]